MEMHDWPRQKQANADVTGIGGEDKQGRWNRNETGRDKKKTQQKAEAKHRLVIWTCGDVTITATW